jgi:hypothetical protein
MATVPDVLLDVLEASNFGLGLMTAVDFSAAVTAVDTTTTRKPRGHRPS